MILQRGGWDLTEPGLHTLLHRIRAAVAASGAQPATAAAGPPPTVAVASTAAGRRSRRRGVLAVLVSTCGIVAGAAVTSWLLGLL